MNKFALKNQDDKPKKKIKAKRGVVASKERSTRRKVRNLFEGIKRGKVLEREKALEHSDDDQRRRIEHDMESERQRVMRGGGRDHPAPRLIDDRSNENKRHPDPMIRAGVGPVAQLSSQAAHTFGYTPEAYDELRKVPTTLTPKSQSRYPDTSYAGIYSPGDKGRIELIDEYADAGILAHEQAHAWWDRRGFEGQATEQYRAGPQDRYMEDFDRWADQSVPGSAAVSSRGDMNKYIDSGYYAETSRPTETFARTVQFSPNADRSAWPEEVRPYYQGFLQGMDQQGPALDYSQKPRFDYERPPQRPGGSPDANGRWGAPVRSWR